MDRKKILGFSIGPIGAALASVITLPIITWFFSAEDVGRISMLQVVSSFAVIFFSLGLDQAYVREYHETDECSMPSLLKATVAPGLLLLVLVSVAVIVYEPGLLSKLLFSIESLTISLIIVCCLLAAFISRFLSLILRMQEKGLAFSMSQVLPKFIFLLFIVSYIGLTTNFNFNKLLIAHVASILAVTLIYGWNTRFIWLPALTSPIHRDKLSKMVQFGFPLIFGGVASWALMAMNRFFLRGMSTYSELEIYSVAASIAASVGILTSVFNTVWTPTVYKWAAAGLVTEKIDEITEHVLALVTAAFIVTGLFSWVLLFLLPPHYAKVQFIVASCIAIPLFYTLSETTAVGIGVSRKSVFSMLASFIAVGVNFFANFILVPRMGATGAAISTAIALWVFLVARTEIASHIWRPRKMGRLYLVTFFSLVLIVGFSLSKEGQQVAWLVVWALCCVLWPLLFKTTALLGIQQFKIIINKVLSSKIDN